ncbi:electron transport complex subunit RsxE [Oleiphilus sp. HI0081]|nr:electron transport complex subunit RsxE [Oleiphilus sp. HI0043]KZY40783.1 electron transport complex subunit RsxE [Oleiphilus sp. HI0050]KZY66201.1 electron transport complex subunit RsxE [Oleiphilus sp. HI0061]KZY73848.1 electron transport complex subunit RsxE [Oleiphilus sp. HI0068]KZY78524.1 electron transport complex subunit RsxE [Oleiphilus sp. HI0069]KZY84790.1 electron transport complex subunit RsxE [Oleiphilus sp. HI0072]KZZ11136.1 electron transport complex subunit RsxE [Oleiphilu
MPEQSEGAKQSFVSSGEFNKLVKNGLWDNNPALVQLLGLCPLLAVTGTVVNALGLGLATTLVLLGSNVSVSLIRNYVRDSVRLPAFVMIIASLVTCAELLMQAFTYELYEILGIFIPLIVTNCAILGRADAYACKNPVLPAATDGLMMGVGFTVVLVLLGAMRELIGQGTLFTGMNLIFGDMALAWEIQVFEDYPNFLFAILPPGAFVGMGLIIALKNIIDQRAAAAKAKTETKKEKGSKRVRVTGKIA